MLREHTVNIIKFMYETMTYIPLESNFSCKKGQGHNLQCNKRPPSFSSMGTKLISYLVAMLDESHHRLCTV
uniref:Reticulon-like protein n=1 Tax=Rhizophora mucronata TaxID=61149 RepID=A0A2P2L7E8_RHIMU